MEMERTRIFSDGILRSWIQGRCQICQRFLSLHKHKYCSRCAKKVHCLHSSKYQKNHREHRREYTRRWAKLHYDSAKRHEQYLMEKIERNNFPRKA